jgi:hypothetical protein
MLDSRGYIIHVKTLLMGILLIRVQVQAVELKDHP